MTIPVRGKKKKEWNSLNKRVTKLEEELPKYELKVGTETSFGGVKSSKEKIK